MLPTALAAGARGALSIKLQLPAHLHITPWAPSRLEAVPAPPTAPLRWLAPVGADLVDWAAVANPDEAHVREVTWTIAFEATGAGAAPVEVDLALYYCSDADGVCVAETAVLELVTATAPTPLPDEPIAIVWDFTPTAL